MKYLNHFLSILTVILVFIISYSFVRASDYWKFIPLPGAYSLSMTEDANGILYLVACNNQSDLGGSGLYRSTDDGDTWEKYGFEGLVNMLRTVYCDKDDILYIGISPSHYNDTAGVLISNDYGKSWNISNIGLQDSTLMNYPVITCFAQKDDGSIYILSSFYICKLMSNGIWQKFENASFGDIELRNNFVLDKNGIFIVSAYDGIFSYDDVNDIRKPLLVPQYADNIFHGVDINSKGHYFATTGMGGTYRSTDNGNTWDSLKYDGRNINRCSSIVIDKQDNIYVDPLLLEKHILKSGDNGETWQDITYNLNDLPSGYIKMYMSKKGYLHLLGIEGMFRSVDKVTSAEESKQEEKNYFDISPNPSRERATITYKTDRLSTVTIEICDALGNRKEAAVNEEKAEGTYRASINTSSYSPGIYFCRLIINGSTSKVEKMVVTK